ncbi:MAG: hypothetical protein CVU14_09395 [Bacteroidetes bacterium HGW-Bacteroidetes-9]|jgi:hypothetical protein|nr:MAG: hypothetical protein CVU14_09395 [Bacteroidetes bacterium HGW-Bacteroidetes-9]
MNQRILFLLVFALISGQSPSAQTYKPGDHWYFGPQIGMASFFGDLSVHDFNLSRKISDESGFAWGLLAGKALNPKIDLRLNYLNGRLKGANPGIDMYFENNFSELNLGASVSISQLIWPGNTARFSLSANVAAGFIHFRAIKYKLSDNSYLSSEGFDPLKKKDGISESSLLLPIGLGLGFRLTNRLTLSGDFSYRLNNSDKIDSQIGNTGISDRYSVASVGCYYIIAPKTKLNGNYYDSAGQGEQSNDRKVRQKDRRRK